MTEHISPALAEKESRLIQALRQLNGVVIAYSGGVDSALLAFYARKTLGNKAIVVIAVSPSLAADELNDARVQAQQFAFDLVEIATDEMDNPNYERNDEMRCYYCKRTLFVELEQIAQQNKVRYIAYGANVDDNKDYRPGHKAAREFEVLSPLQDAGLNKEEIRALARAAGLPSWDRPQAACLASRFPTFEPITLEGLSLIDRSEQFLRSLGFKQVRVRHFGQTARVEIDLTELPRLTGDRELVVRVETALKEFGYQEVVIAPEGYRRGSANTFLPENAAGASS